MTEEYDLFFLLNREVHVVEEHCAIISNGLKTLNFKNLIAWFALHLEDDAGILTRRGLDFFHIELFEHLLT